MRRLRDMLLPDGSEPRDERSQNAVRIEQLQAQSDAALARVAELDEQHKAPPPARLASYGRVRLGR